MGFSMASRSPGNENNLIYINFDVSTMVYCLHQENPGKISFLEKLQILARVENMQFLRDQKRLALGMFIDVF
jgi:hypothetical protein